MAKQRDSAQYARRLLVKAFRHDTLECQRSSAQQRQQSAAAAGAQNQQYGLFAGGANAPPAASSVARLFQFEAKGLWQAPTPSPQATKPANICALQMTLFDSTAKQFFGATYRIEADQLSVFQTPAEAVAKLYAAPPAPGGTQPLASSNATMLWATTDAVVVCVEALSPVPSSLSTRSVAAAADDAFSTNERVIGWWYCALSSITSVTELDLVPGSSALMYLPKQCWPAVPRDPSGAPIARAKFYFQASEMSNNSLPLVSNVVPSGVFAPMKDVFRGPAFQPVPPPATPGGATGNASGRFRCGISSFKVELDSSEINRLLQPISQPGTIPTPAVTGGADSASSWATEVASLFHASSNALPSIAGGPSSVAVEQGVLWDIVCCAHSGYKTASTVGAQFPLQQTSPSRLQSADHSAANNNGFESMTTATTSASVSVAELSDVPNLFMMNLVFAVRFRRAGEQTHRIVGYAVVPLSGDEDADVVYDQVPVLRGPFTAEDARMSSLEQTSPYARLPLRVSVMVRYFNTPIPAKRMEELIENRAHRPEPHLVQAVSLNGQTTPPLHPSTPLVVAGQQPIPISPSATPSEVPTTIVGQQQQQTLPALPQQPLPPGVVLPATTAADGQQTQQQQTIREIVYVPMQQQQPVPPVVQPSAPQPDLAAHKMLCKILEELDQLRAQNERLSNKMGSSSMALGPRHAALNTQSNATTGGPGGAGGSHPSAFEVIDLQPRRCGVSLATRSALVEGVQTILHPVHGTPLSDGMLSEGSLPHSIIGMRLEGLTIDLDRRSNCSSNLNGGGGRDTSSTTPTTAAIPQRLVGFMSFGNLPMQVLAVLQLQLVVQDGDFQSYKVSTGGNGSNKGGYVWHEPPFSHQDNLMLQFKSQGNVHLHFYDAVTMFYQFTSTFSMGMFERPLDAAASLIPLDVSLLMDYSMTEKNVPTGVLPVVYNVGQLHVTLFSVGTSATVTKQNPEAVVLNGGAPAPDNGGLHRIGGPHVVVARKIASSGLDAEHGGPSYSLNNNNNGVPLASSSAVNQQSLDPRNRMHQMRADYVKNLMSANKNGGAIPGVPQQHHHELRREGIEMEYRLRFVEKRRDASKAERIAEVLKQRVTTQHAVTVAGGRTEVYHVNFTNPLPTTSMFAVSVDDPMSKRHLRIGSTANLTTTTSVNSMTPADAAAAKRDAMNHGVGAATFLLGPHETIRIPMLIRCGTDDGTFPTNAQQHLEAVIRGAERGETMLIADILVTFVKPTIDRRFEIFGAPGAEIKKRLFLRLFSAASLPIEGLGTAAAAEKISNMCTYCTVSDAMTTAESKAVIDPITQSHVVAWEEISVQTMIPTTGAKLVFMNIYRDAAMTKHLETWELTIFACQVVHASSIMFGRTTSIALPVTSEKVYVNDPCITAVVPSTGPNEPTKLRYKPREVGTSQTLLHVQREGKHLDKVLLVTQVSYPTPTYQYAIELSAAEAQVPLQRRFLFVNRETSQQVLTVSTNYRHQVRVSPRVFALGPGDSQHLSLEVVGLSLIDGGLTEGQWPIWIFINDEDDGTVESYLLNVVVRLHRPFY